jgi:hypothetical protein
MLRAQVAEKVFCACPIVMTFGNLKVYGALSRSLNFAGFVKFAGLPHRFNFWEFESLWGDVGEMLTYKT